MADFFRQLRGYRSDIKLFLFFNLLANVGLGVFVLIFNLYLTALGLREDDIGVLSAAQTLSMAAAAASMGVMLGRFGVWRTIAGGTVVFVVSAVGLSLSETTTLLLPLTIVFGIGFAFMATATMPFIIEWTRPDQRQQVSAVTFSSAAISTTAGSLLGGLLPNLLPFGEILQYRLTLLLGIVVTASGFYPLLSMGDARRGRAPADPSEAKADTAGDRRRVRLDMAVFVAIGGLMALGAGMVGPFFNVYLATLGASSTAIGLVFAAAGLASAVVGLSAPAVSRRFGSLWAVVVVRTSAAPFFLLLMLVPAFPVAVLAWVARQTSISMAWPIDSTFIAEVLPPRSRASVFGLRSAAWNVGFAVASLVGGVLIVRFGYQLNFLGMVVFTVAAMALFGAYYARHPRITSGDIPSALSPRARGRLERIKEEQAAAAFAGAPALLPSIDVEPVTVEEPGATPNRGGFVEEEQSDPAGAAADGATGDPEQRIQPHAQANHTPNPPPVPPGRSRNHGDGRAAAPVRSERPGGPR